MNKTDLEDEIIDMQVAMVIEWELPIKVNRLGESEDSPHSCLKIGMQCLGIWYQVDPSLCSSGGV